MKSSKLFVPLLTSLFVLLVICDTCLSAKEDDKRLRADLQKFDRCVYQALFGFHSPESYPPRTVDDFRAVCKTQSEAFKCLKEKTKGSLPLIRRGMLALTSTRQRQHKRLCSNLNSDLSKRFLAASKCLMDNKLEQLHENDVRLALSLMEIWRRNFNNSSAELKLLCCSIHNFKKRYFEIANQSCSKHKQMLEEIMAGIVTDDVVIICDDDEKLAKECQKSPKLAINPQNAHKEKLETTIITALYIVATLGEPEEGRPVLN